MRKLFQFVLTSLFCLMSTSLFAESKYIVVGTANLCGSEWSTTDENNLMTSVEGSGVVKTYTNLPKGHYEFYIQEINASGDLGYQYGYYYTTYGDCSTKGYYSVEADDNYLYAMLIAFDLGKTSDVTITLNDCICLTSSAGFAIPFDVTIDGVVYTLEDVTNSATIKDLSNEGGYASDLVIPETVTYEGVTYTVTTVGNLAFSGGDLNSITLPATITTVGYQINRNSSCKTITFLSEKVPAFYGVDESLYGRSVYDSERDAYFYYPLVKVSCGMADDYELYMPEVSSGIRLSVYEKDAYILSVYADKNYGVAKITQRNTCEDNTAVITIENKRDDYKFYSWSDGNRENPRTVTLTSDSLFKAIFKEWRVVNVQSADETQGTVSGNVERFRYDSATITAYPAEGYEFDYWEKVGYSNTYQENPYIFEINRNETYIAHFCKAKVLIGGLNYYLDDETKTARVAKGDYTGEIIIPATVTYNGETYTVNEIREAAFRNNKNITAITIPETFNEISMGVDETHYIPYDCLGGCTNLTTITATTIAIYMAVEPAADGYNYTIKKAIVYNDEAFVRDDIDIEVNHPFFLAWNCKGVEYLDLSDVELTEVGYYGEKNIPFKEKHNIKTLILPKTLTNIPEELCREAWSLQSISIPTGVTEIGDAAFYNCHTLSSVTFEGAPTRIGNYAFYNAHALTSISIPNGVEEVGNAAFYGCTYLTDITIPASVKSMGDNCFALCAKVKSIKSSALVPPTIEDKTFYEVDLNTPLYVYKSAYNAYKADRYWGRFNNIIKVDDMPTDVENADENSFVVYTQSGMIHIEGVDTDYNVFNASGQLIYTGRESVLSLPRGVYVVVVGDVVEKIVL